MRRAMRLSTMTGVAVVVLLVSCRDETRPSPRLADRLKRLESVAYADLRLRDGPAAHALEPGASFALYPYYEEANRALLDLIARISENRVRNLVACVIAPAGYGKSPLTDHLRETVLEGAFFIDLKEAVTRLPGHEARADLIVTRGRESFEMNALPYADDARRVLEAIPIETEVLLVDSIDEIHPDAAADVLDALEGDVRHARAHGRRRCVLLFGRAEGFGAYLARPDDPLRRQLFLNSPEWRSVGDLQNLFRSIVRYTGREYSDEVFQSFAAAARRSPRFLECLRLLSLAVFLVEREYGRPADDAAATRRAIHERLLERSLVTHGRPAPGSLYGDLYLRVLRAVAEKYVSGVELDPGEPHFGFFSVGTGDVIRLASGESAPVWAVLDRSGLVEFRPLDRATRRYRFVPLWMHRQLLEDGGSR